MMRVAILILVCLVPIVAHGEEATEIPLDEVWGYHISGTTPIAQLFERSEWGTRSIPTQIEIAERLCMSCNKTDAPRGFAVKGSPCDAFIDASEILTEGAEPAKKFSSDDEIHVVFFAHSPPGYLAIDAVHRHANKIEIAYRFVPHAEDEILDHLAIIPLGKLPVGEYQVEPELAPLKAIYPAEDYGNWSERASEPEVVRKSVSGAFRFIVKREN